MNQFSCPIDCLPGIGEVWKGEYNLAGLEFKSPPTVVDIGANCGAFAIWARMRWGAKKVYCYEPNPALWPYLTNNGTLFASRVQGFEFLPVNAAVGPTAHCEFYAGKETNLCGSIVKSGSTVQESIQVNMVDPKDIPECHILKVDTEGAEAFIISNLTFTPLYLAVEWHGECQRLLVELVLKDKMHLVASSVSGKGYGMLKYIRNDAMDTSTQPLLPTTPEPQHKE